MAATITPESVWAHIPPRARDSHKGSFGAVLVVAGSACYRGAASLAVEGALRTGAGIVTLASVEPVLAAVSARLPECCLCPCLAGAEGGISPRSLPNITRQKATTLLLGPGPGRGDTGAGGKTAARLWRQRGAGRRRPERRCTITSVFWNGAPSDGRTDPDTPSWGDV